MKIATRLVKGQDLKRSIEEVVSANKLKSAIVLSSVGCLSEAVIRMAGGKDIRNYSGDYEIIVVNGTISKAGAHLHIGLSDKEGLMFGGHMCYGCIVNTTCELVVESVDGYSFTREFDENTGYKELVISNKED